MLGGYAAVNTYSSSIISTGQRSNTSGCRACHVSFLQLLAPRLLIVAWHKLATLVTCCVSDGST